MIVGFVALLATAVLATAVTSSPVARSLINMSIALGTYWAVMRFVAQRRVPEISFSMKTVREMGTGLAIGVGLLATSLGIITALGGYTITWANNPSPVSIVLHALISGLATGIFEELLLRGVVFQALERLGGSLVAIAGSAILFGVMHLMNPGATLWSALAIAIEAGVVLGLVFAWRRSIWTVVAFHAVWNALLMVLAIPVSGNAAKDGLFVFKVSGSELLTGGGFGIEASIVPVVIGVVISGFLFVVAKRRGRILSYANRAAMEELR